MAVVVQQMVVPQAAGSVYGRPRHLQPEGCLGGGSFVSGEALGSGLVNADTFTVRNGEVVARRATKQRAIHARR